MLLWPCHVWLRVLSKLSYHPQCHAVSCARDVLTRRCMPSQNPNSMGWVALNACILILILVGMRILVYIALRYKTSRK